VNRRCLRRTLTERGSAVVDFVLVAVIVVPLFLGVLQVGLFLYVRTTMTAAASDGARLAATADRGPDDGVARTESMIDGAVSARLVDSVQAQTVDLDGRPAVEVVVHGHMPALGLWGPSVEFTVRGHGIEEVR
jgi:Flp pilus assembly protein TadG